MALALVTTLNPTVVLPHVVLISFWTRIVLNHSCENDRYGQTYIDIPYTVYPQCHTYHKHRLW